MANHHASRSRRTAISPKKTHRCDLSHGFQPNEDLTSFSTRYLNSEISLPQMQKHNLCKSAEYGEKSVLSRVLVDRPGYRLVHLNLRAGRGASETESKESLTIYVVSGHITFYKDDESVDLKTGEVSWSEGNSLHRLEAHEDTSLLVAAISNPIAAETVLDLRTVPPFQRHPLVFATFDALSRGESFVLINDHDPIPLNRQMESMRPHQLTWEYIERGPDIFQIRVRRIAPLAGSETSPSAIPQNLWGIQTGR